MPITYISANDRNNSRDFAWKWTILNMLALSMKNFISSHPAPNASSTSTWAKLSPLESSSVHLSVWDICLCHCARFMFWCSVILAYWNIQHFPGRGEANSGINTLSTRSKTIQQLISCVDQWVFCYVDSIWHMDWNNFLSAALCKINLAELLPLSLLSGVLWSRKREQRQRTRQSDGRTTTWKSRRLTTSRSDNIRLLC